MKKYFILCIIFSLNIYSQNISFSDINLKNALKTQVCVDADNDGSPDAIADSNGDGEISVSEALNIVHLILENKNISSVSGLENFSNLQTLSLSENNISSFSLSGFTNLKQLDISDNNLINFSVNNHANIEYIGINDNALLNVTVTNCSKLVVLELNGNNLNNLNISNLPVLYAISFVNNNLSSLVLNNFPELVSLNVSNNNLSSLTFSNVEKLYSIDCSDNSLINLNVSNFGKLNILHCYNNQLQTLQLQNTPLLNTVYCHNNSITSLDFSSSPMLNVLVAENNSLTYLNLKNGTLGSTYAICGNPNLTQICVDNIPSEIQHLTMQMGPMYCSNTNFSISTTCFLNTDEVEKSIMKIYPNPFTDHIIVNNYRKNDRIEIYDMAGKTVYSNLIKTEKINLSHLSQGTYLIKIFSQNKVFKFIKL